MTDMLWLGIILHCLAITGGGDAHQKCVTAVRECAKPAIGVTENATATAIVASCAEKQKAGKGKL